MRLLDKIKNRLTGASLGNEVALALVNEELSQGIKQDDIWEVAEAKCSGDASLTKLVYAKLRAEQLRDKAEKKLASIQEDSQKNERNRRKAVKEAALAQDKALARQEKIDAIKNAINALQFLEDNGFEIRQYYVGKKAIHWDIFDGSFFYKARSAEEIVEYANRVRRDLKLRQSPSSK